MSIRAAGRTRIRKVLAMLCAAAFTLQGAGQGQEKQESKGAPKESDYYSIHSFEVPEGVELEATSLSSRGVAR